MGQGVETNQTINDPTIDVQERGEIFFFYRPKVGKIEAHAYDDVQRLYIVLSPESGERAVEVKQASDSDKEDSLVSDDKSVEGGHGSEEVNIEEKPLLRFAVMGKKSLPDPSKRSKPYWGFVEIVTTKIEDIKAALRGEERETSTRGRRRTAPARALAEGVYRILKHNSGKKAHTHLVYKLEFPRKDEKHEPQESLNIEREGSFIIQVKNPNQPSTSSFVGLQSKRKANFPAHLQGLLGQLRFASVDPPDFLNYEGCEFLLISASDDIEEELGLEIETEEREPDMSHSDLAEIFGDVVSAKPLFSGDWM